MGMQSHAPSFSFYPKDFAGDGTVAAMTTKSVGAYTLLLCKAWYQEPVGTIPDDDRVLAKWSGLSLEEWKECRVEVLPAFKLGEDGRYHQKRMQDEYTKQLAYREERSRAGKYGVEVRERRRKDRQNKPEAEHKPSLSGASILHEAKSSFPFPFPFPSPTNRIESSDGSDRSERGGCNPGPYAEFLKAKLSPKNNHDHRFLNRVGRAVDAGLITEDMTAGALAGCDGAEVTRPIGMFTSALRKNVLSAGRELESLLASLDQEGSNA